MRLIVQRVDTSSMSGSFASGHVYLLALAEKNEQCDAKSKGNNLVQLIMLDFSPNAKNTLYNVNLPDYSKFYELEDNENRIVLHSSVPYTDFVKQLMKSEYRNKEAYNPYSNNCVHAVSYALKLADIHINTKADFGIRHLICCFWCPSKITTPREFIHKLKQYQAIAPSVKDLNSKDDDSEVASLLGPRIT